MNHKLAITAIALFAVTMGMSLFTPAMAKADTTICHFAEEETVLIDTNGDGMPDTPVVEPAHWKFLTLNNNGATNGHLKNHGQDTDSDGTIDIRDFLVTDSDTRSACQTLVDG